MSGLFTSFRRILCLDNLPFVILSYVYQRRKEEGHMNVRLLKAKRVEKNLYQKDLAKALNITEKAMSQKECSPVNKFKADEMVTIAKTLNLSFSEFDAIFF